MSNNNVLTGGRVNYYLVEITHPQREEQPAYQAECEDIIEALKLTPNEANIFKAIWRSASARLGNGKPDHKAEYDAEKMVHYANRNLRALRIDAAKALGQEAEFTQRVRQRTAERIRGVVQGVEQELAQNTSVQLNEMKGLK
jgi:hypothetical protein